MTRARRRSWVAAAFGAALLLTGCVYLRLLQVKRQLNDFDAHFAVGGPPGWTLAFKKPPMLAKDSTFLIGAAPLSISTETGGAVRYYEFERVRPSTDAAPAPLDLLTLRLHARNGLVTRIDVPDNFLQVFSGRVLEETFRQAKDAEVHELKRTARAVIRLSPEAAADLPVLSRVRELMGAPLREDAGEDGLLVLIHRYRIVGDKRGVPIIAELSFSADGLLRRCVIRWDTSTVDASFARP